MEPIFLAISWSFEPSGMPFTKLSRAKDHCTWTAAPVMATRWLTLSEV